MPLYDGFISYSHAKDKPIAAALQSVVQKLGKPWYRRRALRVFRDDTSLSATPHLWPSIEKALAESGHLILLASPEAARSPWIAKEVAYWLKHKSADTLFIGLTDGSLDWAEKKGDFKWTAKTPLPKILKGRFASEPKWVDLRAYREGADPRNAHFIELGADFAAAIRGMPKEDLLSQEVRQQRRALTLAMSAAASLLVFAVAAGWQWQTAESERTLKTEQLRQAQINESQYLGARARQAAENGNFELAKTLMALALPERVDMSDRPIEPSAAGAIATAIAKDPIDSILLGHTGHINSLAFSPDGTMLVTASADGTARVWNAATGETLHILQGVYSAAFSSDGKRILTASSDATARIWDAETGAQLLDANPEPNIDRNEGRFSRDGTKIFIVLESGEGKILDAATGAELSVLKSDDNPIYDGDFSPDGKRVVTSSRDKVVTLWDAATAQPIRTVKGGSDKVRPIYSPDGQSILVTTTGYQDTDPIMQLLAATSGETLQIVRFGGYNSLSATPVFSGDGSRLAAGFKDGAVYAWRTDPASPERVLAGDGKTETIAFSPDGKRVLAGAFDSVAMFDAATGRRLYTLPDSWGEASFSPDGGRVLTRHRKKSSIWDSASGKLVVALQDDRLMDFARFSPDGQRVLTIFYDHKPVLWDAVTGERLLELDYAGEISGYAGKILDAAFSPDGTRILTVTPSDSTIWDAATGEQLRSVQGGDPSRYEDLNAGNFNHAGTQVAMGGIGGTGRVWDAATGKMLHLLEPPGRVSIEALAFNPDDTLLAVAYDDGTVLLWDATNGERLRALKGHEFGELGKITFSPDGESILTTSKTDGTARLWDTATGTPIAILEGYDKGSEEGRNGSLSEITGAAFSPDGDEVVVASKQKKIRIWRVPRNLEAAASYLRASISRHLSWEEREEVGLEQPPAPKAQSCGEAAADPFDPRSGGIGVSWAELNEEAFPLCEAAVSRDPADAKQLYQLARAQQRADASNWGWIDYSRDFASSFRTAAAAGYPMALLAVAGLKDTPPDEAMKLLLRAHEDGVTLAAKSIAQRYAEGNGVAKDPGKALEWLRLGAQQGDPWAHGELGWVYREGDANYGIVPNREQALLHFMLALNIFDAHGYEDGFETKPAMLYRASVARQLPMHKVAEIWKLAQGWKPADPLPELATTSQQQTPQIGAALH
ncbi:MAG: PQQ-binding-like beta-propeller repeat protein [Methyloceanibacter sp.]